MTSISDAAFQGMAQVANMYVASLLPPCPAAGVEGQVKLTGLHVFRSILANNSLASVGAAFANLPRLASLYAFGLSLCGGPA
jgi:hypothetical protein